MHRCGEKNKTKKEGTLASPQEEMLNVIYIRITEVCRTSQIGIVYTAHIACRVVLLNEQNHASRFFFICLFKIYFVNAVVQMIVCKTSLFLYYAYIARSYPVNYTMVFFCKHFSSSDGNSLIQTVLQLSVVTFFFFFFEK